MRECPAIIAALPREVKHLVRGWQEHRLPGKIVAYSNDLAVVACAGMGAARATLAHRYAGEARNADGLRWASSQRTGLRRCDLAALWRRLKVDAVRSGPPCSARLG